MITEPSLDAGQNEAELPDAGFPTGRPTFASERPCNSLLPSLLPLVSLLPPPHRLGQFPSEVWSGVFLLFPYRVLNSIYNSPKDTTCNQWKKKFPK